MKRVQSAKTVAEQNTPKPDAFKSAKNKVLKPTPESILEQDFEESVTLGNQKENVVLDIDLD